MARYSDTSITSLDLAEYLKNQDDFGLELFIYSKAKALGFNASHGGTYEDPITKKPRQYDVRAFKVLDFRRIDLAIECKSLKSSYPLLISCIPRSQEESFHHVVWSYKRSNSNFDITLGMPSAKTLTLKASDGFYPTGKLVGKSTTQVGKNDRGEFVSGDADVYEKWAQALGSCSELVQNTAHHYQGSANGSIFSVILPILVVADDTLWKADYSEDGELKGEPHKVNEVTLFTGREYWQAMGIAFTVSHLHIYTRTGIELFLNKIATDTSFWDTILPPDEIRNEITNSKK